MTKYAELPNGKYVGFPDDWSEAKMDEAVYRDFADLFPKPQPSTTDQVLHALGQGVKSAGSSVLGALGVGGPPPNPLQDVTDVSAQGIAPQPALPMSPIVPNVEMSTPGGEITHGQYFPENIAQKTPDPLSNILTRMPNGIYSPQDTRNSFDPGPEATDTLSARNSARAVMQMQGVQPLTREKDLQNVLEQFTGGAVEGASAGLIQDIVPDTTSTAQEISKGVGNLAGFLVGAPGKATEFVSKMPAWEKMATATGTSFQINRRAMAVNVLKDMASLAAGFGVASIGEALQQPGARQALETIRDSAIHGAEMGGVFSVTGRFLPKSMPKSLKDSDKTSQWISRFVIASAALDALDGKAPWDDRTVAQKAFDYAANAFFTRHGTPMRLVKPDLKSVDEQKRIDDTLHAAAGERPVRP